MNYGTLLHSNLLDGIGTDSLLLILHFIFVSASWFYLLTNRKSARESLCWGIAALALPFVGSWAMLVYFTRKRPTQH